MTMAQAEQPSEGGFLAHRLARHGDEPHGGGLVVDHADGHLVGDDRRRSSPAGCRRGWRSCPGPPSRRWSWPRASPGSGARWRTASASARSSLTGMKAPDSPPTGWRRRPALLDRVVEHGHGGGRAGRARRARTPRVLRISPTQSPTRAWGPGRGRRCRRRRPAGGHFAADQLAHPGDAEAGDLDLLGQVAQGAFRVLLEQALHLPAHHPGPADPDVDDALRLAGPEVGPGHEGVVLGDVGEHDQLGAAEAVRWRPWPGRSAG